MLLFVKEVNLGNENIYIMGYLLYFYICMPQTEPSSPQDIDNSSRH